MHTGGGRGHFGPRGSDLMIDWTEGYRADIDYTYGYYGELNPLRTSLQFLAAGLAPPARGTACELGFGQGISVNIHAAASPTQWHATDFNPSQAGFAQELATATGAKAHLYDEAFEQFCSRSDLPQFDFIGVHGIWSWISDHNRKVMVEFLRNKLRVGGVLYMSYNTQPGWAPMVPMRRLLTEHAEIMGAEGRGIGSRIEAAIEFAEKLLELNPHFHRANPGVAERLKKIKTQSRNYLAHEYFNRDWQPMAFSEMAEWLSPAKLGFACPAHYTDLVDAINLTKEWQAFLKEIPEPMFRETVRDFLINQQFRRDYWVKGPRRLSSLEQLEQLRALKVVLTVRREDINFKAKGALGEASLNEAIYAPIADAVGDGKVHTLGEIEKSLKAKGIAAAQIVESVVVMAGKGDLTLAQEKQEIAAAKPKCDAFNRFVMIRSRAGNQIQFLASPVTGGGVPADRFQQLFLFAKRNGGRTPEDWAKATWDILAMQNQRLAKEGKAIETAEANLSELIAQAKEFAAKRLPVLQALLVE